MRRLVGGRSDFAVQRSRAPPAEARSAVVRGGNAARPKYVQKSAHLGNKDCSEHRDGGGGERAVKWTPRCGTNEDADASAEDEADNAPTCRVVGIPVRVRD